MSHAMFRAYAEAVKAEIGTATTTRFIALAETTDGRFGLFHHSMLPGGPAGRTRTTTPRSPSPSTS